MNRSALTAALVALTFGAGCDNGAVPTAADPVVEPLAASITGADLDIAGTWNWSETTNIKALPLAAAVFGIAVEGPVTDLSCDAWGELTITQNGVDFTASATQSSWCTTKGGQAFDPFPIFPASFDLEGHLVSRSLRFVVDTGGFPCNYQGSVRVGGEAVTEMRATGDCDVPNEFGNDKILGWKAVRP